MPGASRRGFTLVELLIAIGIFGIVSASIYGLLVRTQRLSRTQAERSIMQANLRTGMALVTSELRELNATATRTDIYAMSSTSIHYRGLRGLGFLCEVTTGSIKVPRGAWQGYRDPIVGRDSLLIFVENNPDLASDDGWTRRGITAVAASTCAWGASLVAPAMLLTLADNLGVTDTLPMVLLGAPVRAFERMEIGQMTAGGETWLGARSNSAGETTLQPVLGPLAATGVSFSFWTGVAGTGGTQTSTPLAVRTIRLTLRGLTENIVAAGAGTVAWQRATDSLVTDIRLRNAP